MGAKLHNQGLEQQGESRALACPWRIYLFYLVFVVFYSRCSAMEITLMLKKI
jgi:hypothetical protein